MTRGGAERGKNKRKTWELAWIKGAFVHSLAPPTSQINNKYEE